MKTLETIFDHNVTDEEQKILFCSPYTKEEYLFLRRTSDSEYARIYRLYFIRNDHITAQKYLDKIKNQQFKFDTQLVDTFFE